MLTKEQLHKLSTLDGWGEYCEDNKGLVLAKAHEIFKRAKERGKLPKQTIHNKTEWVDSRWISTRKSSRGSRTNSKKLIWYPELEDIAKQYGFANAFDITDGKSIALEKAHEIFNRAKLRGKLPVWSEKIKQEKVDRIWIDVKINSKQGKGSNVWYPEFEEIAKQYGFADAFDIKDAKSIALEKAHEVFARAKQRGGFNFRSTEKQEKQDAKWLQSKKTAKQGGDCVWYPEFAKIAKQYGFVNIFEFKDIKKLTLEKAHEVFKRAKQRGKLPKQYDSRIKSKNELSPTELQEAKDSMWLSSKKSSKKNIGTHVWYSELDTIARKYGFINAFDTKV